MMGWLQPFNQLQQCKLHLPQIQKHQNILVMVFVSTDAVILRPATLHKSLEFFESIIHLCNTDAFRNAIIEKEDRRADFQVLESTSGSESLELYLVEGR